MDQTQGEIRKLVTFETLISEQVHQLDRLKELSSRLRVIRECVGGPVPEKAECGKEECGSDGNCFLDRAMKISSDICGELRDIEQEVVYLESICCNPKNKVPLSKEEIDRIGRRARFDQGLR